MAQKRREMLTKKTASLSDDEGAESDEEVLNGDEMKSVFNVDVLLSEEKNPWLKRIFTFKRLQLITVFFIRIKESVQSEETIAHLTTTLKEVAKKTNKKIKETTNNVNPNDYGFVSYFVPMIKN